MLAITESRAFSLEDPNAVNEANNFVYQATGCDRVVSRKDNLEVFTQVRHLEGLSRYENLVLDANGKPVAGLYGPSLTPDFHVHVFGDEV